MESRRKKIIELIQAKKYVSIDFLVKTLHYSPSTIRRDLNFLEKLSILKRTSGGAVLVKEELVENPQLLKTEIHKEEKRIIAELAIDFVEDYATLFLDASSTSQFLAERLNTRKHLKIFTPSLITALTIDSKKNNQPYCLGGLINDGKSGGPLCEAFAAEISVDYAFISCRGFDLHFGASDVLETESGIKKSIIKNAKKVFLMLDHSKFNKRYSFKSIDTADIDYLLTDKKPILPTEIPNAHFELVYWDD